MTESATQPDRRPELPPILRRFRWQFALPLLLQLAIVASVPMPKAITLTTGETVFLTTVPVDPYDLLRGRYITLDYDIAQTSTLTQLPGWLDPPESHRPISSDLFITIEPSNAAAGDRPLWQAVAVSRQWPTDLGPNQQVLRGQISRWNTSIDLGLGQYFIPESIGDRLEADIRAHPDDTVVEAKVDAWGNSALVHLWVEDRRY